jgi:hypothetical protein
LSREKQKIKILKGAGEVIPMPGLGGAQGFTVKYMMMLEMSGQMRKGFHPGEPFLI